MSIRKICCTALIFCSSYLQVGVVLADTIYLKNNDVFSGKIISYENEICVFKSQHESVLRIKTSDIQKILTDGPYEVRFTTGEKVIGILVSGENNTTSVHSETIGSTTIDVSAIKQMVRHFAKSNEAVESKSKDSFGKEVEKQPPLEFLTGSTILLAPGQYQLDFGVDYRQNRDYYPLPMDGYFQNHSYSARMLRFDASLRAGLYEGFEGWISIPYTYTYLQQVSSNAYVRDKEEWQLADIAAGLQYQLTNETSKTPAISLTIAVSSPSGERHYYDSENDWKDPLNNGSGHWIVSPGVAFVRSLDPAMIFGGISYNYLFKEDIDGYKIEPGWGLSAYWGVGFALNDSLSLGTRFSYSYSSNMNANDIEVQGSDKDAMDISFSASYRFTENWVTTPQLTYSLNNDAGASIFSLRFNRLIN